MANVGFSEPALAPPFGQRVHMRCKPGQAHVFDATGKLVHQ